MTKQNKVIVKINGQDFTVVGDESEEYIKNIANYVDENIGELIEKNNKLSKSMAAILAAFNIADKYFKSSRELEQLKTDIVGPLKEYEKAKKELEELKKSFQEIKSEYEKCKFDLNKIKKLNESKDAKIKQYEQALQLKEKELENAQKIINDLQDKLFENQLELINTKKELEETLKTIEDI